MEQTSRMNKKKQSFIPKKNKAQKPLKNSEIIKKINTFFETSDGKSYLYHDLLKKFNLFDNFDRKFLKDQLFVLEKKGIIIRNKEGKYKSNESLSIKQGIVNQSVKDYAFVDFIDGEGSSRVRSKNLNHAIHGDVVEIIITKKERTTQRSEAIVKKIIQRKNKKIIGTASLTKGYCFILPSKKNFFFDVFIPFDKSSHVKNGEKVIVKINQWHSNGKKNPVGEIQEILGKEGEHEVEIHAIMAEFELPKHFPKKTEKKANKIPKNIPQEEIDKRKDYRAICTFTIDPEDAKDFDDALSFQAISEDIFEVGIHIADVSHYVLPEDDIDYEAKKRGTSVYLVDRTIPMLPESLSNDICSLNPMQDKLTFSVIYQMNTGGEVLKEWMGKTIINSNKKFTYEEAQNIIQGAESEYAFPITTLNNVAKKINEKRIEKGALNLDGKEVKFKLDENGDVIDVTEKIRRDAHKMIEEYMLLANKSVAEFMYKQCGNLDDKAFVYRIHEDPDIEKLKIIKEFVKILNIKEKLVLNHPAKSLNKLTLSITDRNEKNILENLIMRAMKKAKYTTEPKHHFGLSFEHYTHFTSPIRRYPDLIAHRLLEKFISYQQFSKKSSLESICRYCLERENIASNAERASIRYKQVDYMSNHLGTIFDGIVTGVTKWGLFVEMIPTSCEGMIRMKDLDYDFFEYDEKNMRVIGRKTKDIIQLGDPLRVIINHTDLNLRMIDLKLAN